MSDLIHKIYVQAPGDPSVGIFSQTLVIQQDGAPDGFVFDLGVLSEEDRRQERSFIRDTLRQAFGMLLEDDVRVWFDDEEQK
jgi:hypothetical protein